MFPMIKILLVLGIFLIAVKNGDCSNLDNKHHKVEQNKAKSFVYFYFNQDNNNENKYGKSNFYKEHKYKKPTKSSGMKYSYTTKYKPEENLQSLNFHTTTPNIYKENLIDEEDLKKVPAIIKNPYKFEEDSFKPTPNIFKDILEDSHYRSEYKNEDNQKHTKIATCKYPCSLKQKPGEGPSIMSLFTTTTTTTTTTPTSIVNENLLEDQYLVNEDKLHSPKFNIFGKVESSTFKYPYIPKYKPEEVINSLGFYSTTPNIFKEDLIDYQHPISVKPANIYYNPGYNPYKFPANLENFDFNRPHASKVVFEDEHNILSLHTTPSTIKESWWKTHHKPTVISHLEYKLPSYPKVPQLSPDSSEEKYEDESEDSEVSVEETPKHHKVKGDHKQRHHKNKSATEKPHKNKKNHQNKKSKNGHNHKNSQEHQKHHKNKKHHKNAQSKPKVTTTHGKPYTRKIIVPIRSSSSKTKPKKGVLKPKHFNGEVDKQTVDLINAIINTIQDNVDNMGDGSEENPKKTHKKVKVDWSMEGEGST